MNTCGLYIHIPFCLQKCYYCDFVSIAFDEKIAEEYIDSLLKEAKSKKDKFADTLFDTIYIGGGTPSILKVKHFDRLISGLNECFNLAPIEFTIEINPATGSRKLFEFFKSSGVTRASIGLQCANDIVLQSVNRAHNTEDFIETINLLNSLGINNISADVMTMLPRQSIDDVLNTIELISRMKCSHISMYTLKLEQDTPLHRMYNDKRIVLPSENTEIQMSEKARELMNSLGYIRYEISNYAKDKKISKHNMKYWLRKDYLGLGVSAASCYDDVRYTNTYLLDEYIKAMNNGETKYASYEYLTKENKMEEMLILNTRLTQGMSYKDYKAEFNIDFYNTNKDKLLKLKKRGMITSCPAHLILTDTGLDLQNQVLLELL